MQNYYRTLGLRPGVTDKQIYRAFRALAKKYHPDSGHEQACAKRFMSIKKAYEALKSPDKRAKFEAQQKALNEIEKFQIRARYNRHNAASSFSYRGSQRRGVTNVIQFPKKESNSYVMKLFKKCIRFFCETLLLFEEELTNAIVRRDNEHHKILTRKLNRIPDSEIGLREAS